MLLIISEIYIDYPTKLNLGKFNPLFLLWHEARAPLRYLKLFPLLYFAHDVENVYLSGFVFEGVLSQDANKLLPRSFAPLFRSCRALSLSLSIATDRIIAM